MADQPLVTIGVPVYNEARYIHESMKTLLSQSYSNIEFLIGDNASNDGTSEICEKYASEHPTIRYVRHPENIGQHANFNWLVHHAKGKYFCWGSAHDLLDPDFVEKSVEALENRPEAVLGYPRTINMTKEGEITREKVRPFDITKMPPAARFREVMWRVDCNYVYGMWRLEPMQQSKVFQQFPACDRVFLAEMAIKGTFVPVDTFKYYRMSRERVESEVEKRRRIMHYLTPGKVWTDAELAHRSFYAPMQRAYYAIIRESRLSLSDRLRTYTSIWLSGVMKAHLLPGAGLLSALTKKILPKPLLNALMRTMQ
ncbi:MAG: glycosyltransferase family 2 protein [Candidatus Peribacteraceae bacterium]